jgi:DNA-binding MarR family transcriptional regulator
LRALSAASDLLDAAVAQRLNIHRTDLRCLDHLARSGPLPAGRLAEAVGLSTGALTIAIDRLQTAGYARRRADATDRRRVVVELTRKADRVSALFGDLAVATDRLLEAYSDAEIGLLETFLRASTDVLTRQAHSVSARRRLPR